MDIFNPVHAGHFLLDYFAEIPESVLPKERLDAIRGLAVALLGLGEVTEPEVQLNIFRRICEMALDLLTVEHIIHNRIGMMLINVAGGLTGSAEDYPEWGASALFDDRDARTFGGKGGKFAKKGRFNVANYLESIDAAMTPATTTSMGGGKRVRLAADNDCENGDKETKFVPFCWRKRWLAALKQRINMDPGGVSLFFEKNPHEHKKTLSGRNQAYAADFAYFKERVANEHHLNVTVRDENEFSIQATEKLEFTRIVF